MRGGQVAHLEMLTPGQIDVTDLTPPLNSRFYGGQAFVVFDLGVNTLTTLTPGQHF